MAYYTIDNTALFRASQRTASYRNRQFQRDRNVEADFGGQEQAMGSRNSSDDAGLLSRPLRATWTSLMMFLMAMLVGCNKSTQSADVTRGGGVPVVATSNSLTEGAKVTTTGVGSEDVKLDAAAQAALDFTANFPAGFTAGKLPVLPREYAELSAAEFAELRATLAKDSEQWIKTRLEFYQAWAAVSPGAALEDARRTNASENTICTGAALRGLIGVNPNEANAWLAAKTSGSERAMLACEFVKAATPESLPALGDWVSSQTGDPTVVPLINSLMSAWAQTDPGPSAAWLAQQSEPERFPLATEVVYSAWVKTDPRAASEHLQAMPVSPLRDRAVFVFATYLAIEDASSAETWGQSIQSPEIKAECLAAIASNHPKS
jgi:hypothetical protein